MKHYQLLRRRCRRLVMLSRIINNHHNEASNCLKELLWLRKSHLFHCSLLHLRNPEKRGILCIQTGFPHEFVNTIVLACKFQWQILDIFACNTKLFCECLKALLKAAAAAVLPKYLARSNWPIKNSNERKRRSNSILESVYFQNKV